MSKGNGLTKHLLIYEILNTVGNIFTIMFGIVFPLFMVILFTNVIGGQVPETERMDVRTSIFLTMTMIIPMATMFIGYAANYSQEIENNTPLRLDLFGISKRNVLTAKLLSNLLFLVASTGIYFAVSMPIIEIHPPTVGAIMLLLVVVIFVGGILLMLSHAIASLCGKFGLTYSITMALYFGFMTLCGMMGIQVAQLPTAMQNIARLFPMAYMGGNDDFLRVWKGESYDFTSFVLSFIALAVISGIVLLISLYKNKRKPQ